MFALNKLTSVDFPTFDDPRFVRAADGVRSELNWPVLNGRVRTAQVYDSRPGYNLGYYRDFEHINGGTTTYYFDANIDRPFINFVFGQTATPLIAVDYFDPQGTFKQHFRRSTPYWDTGLTWLSDTQWQRDDLMASQQWKRNQQGPFLNLEQ